MWAAALITFFGCRRLGETTVSSPSSFDGRYHVLRSTIVAFNTLRDGSRSVTFCIPWTKTTCEEGTSVIATARKDSLCPYTAMHNHLEVNRDAPPSTSLFAYTSSTSGRWEHLTKYKFMEFCTGVWADANLAHIQGHSFWIGGAVELLLAGIPPEIVHQEKHKKLSDFIDFLALNTSF